ncbi:Uma2 family endonuclease [Nostoc sp. UCD121]|uniref:Uma2 family endonuclease n=1 Tax=unclassified Nostoc TaxID=2593658 RepID=UPI00162929D9|nr:MULTISPECIES: Uma2 family endonuclease [unclassified Nostoc]MBC1218873.1 Uma2 family endonuclease [Nostoc sp. UCD120]MBC1276533.1 Uma2 family endonuclease [Nostoc sp. UCD121]MBC1299909.1 Uma2 family endonuclease [Nostoc sp. UCD122]
MLNYDPLACLPSSEELPDSDDTPVDNELQDLIPGLLKALLAMAWPERMDWFFGVDMGIYYDSDLPPIVPDGFLSLGVERFYDENLRPSYVLWEEKKLPILALEVVSKTYRGEYSTKKAEYARLGFLYYVVYNPFRRRKPRLEVYKLVNNVYELHDGNPVWLPEISLGIGIERGTYLGIPREWMYWYNQQGQRFLTPEEDKKLAQQEAQQAKQEAQLAQRRTQLLAERLRSLGIDPDLI